MPRIYLVSSERYNSSKKDSGAWIDIKGSDTRKGILRRLRDELDLTSAEFDSGELDYAIHDYEDFLSLKINEHDTIGFIIQVVDLIERETNVDLILTLLGDGFCESLEAAVEFHNNNYVGEYTDIDDYVIELVEKGAFGEVPPALEFYIDNAALGRDMELNGDIITHDSNGHVNIWRAA